jgi:hypothetical protein
MGNRGGILNFKPKATKKQQRAMAELLKRYHRTGKPVLPPIKLEQPGLYSPDILGEGQPEEAVQR